MSARPPFGGIRDLRFAVGLLNWFCWGSCRWPLRSRATRRGISLFKRRCRRRERLQSCYSCPGICLEGTSGRSSRSRAPGYGSPRLRDAHFRTGLTRRVANQKRCQGGYVPQLPDVQSAGAPLAGAYFCRLLGANSVAGGSAETGRSTIQRKIRNVSQASSAAS